MNLITLMLIFFKIFMNLQNFIILKHENLFPQIEAQKTEFKNMNTKNSKI